MDEYTVIRSSRRTIAIEVREGGEVVVRAPQRTSLRRIQEFVACHETWIRETQRAVLERSKHRHVISDQERRDGIAVAKALIPERVSFYARRMGVSYGRITIREQKTRWGSCSVKGNLNFNWKLVLVPPALLDYVVVHELAHRMEMNHSSAFWDIVAQEIPDYAVRRRMLRDYEAVI